MDIRGTIEGYFTGKRSVEKGRGRKLHEKYGPDTLPEGTRLSFQTPEKRFKTMMKSPKYQVYTMIDSGRRWAYVKGYHYVNRTGEYAVVPKLKVKRK